MDVAGEPTMHRFLVRMKYTVFLKSPLANYITNSLQPSNHPSTLSLKPFNRTLSLIHLEPRPIPTRQRLPRPRLEMRLHHLNRRLCNAPVGRSDTKLAGGEDGVGDEAVAPDSTAIILPVPGGERPQRFGDRECDIDVHTIRSIWGPSGRMHADEVAVHDGGLGRDEIEGMAGLGDVGMGEIEGMLGVVGLGEIEGMLGQWVWVRTRVRWGSWSWVRARRHWGRYRWERRWRSRQGRERGGS